MTQWTQVPRGASGSSTMSAKLRVSTGISVQDSGRRAVLAVAAVDGGNRLALAECAELVSFMRIRP